jgi:hypothetical protein
MFILFFFISLLNSKTLKHIITSNKYSDVILQTKKQKDNIKNYITYYKYNNTQKQKKNEHTQTLHT